MPFLGWWLCVILLFQVGFKDYTIVVQSLLRHGQRSLSKNRLRLISLLCVVYLCLTDGTHWQILPHRVWSHRPSVGHWLVSPQWSGHCQRLWGLHSHGKVRLYTWNPKAFLMTKTAAHTSKPAPPIVNGQVCLMCSTFDAQIQFRHHHVSKLIIVIKPSLHINIK